jgi:hypothetical protein
MAARFEQKLSFNKLNYKPTQVRNYKLNSQTALKLRVGVVPGVCHPRLRLHPVLINPVLVRTQTPRPLYIASGIGRSNTCLALLDPLGENSKIVEMEKRFADTTALHGSPPKPLSPEKAKQPRRILTAPNSTGCGQHLMGGARGPSTCHDYRQ